MFWKNKIGAALVTAGGLTVSSSSFFLILFQSAFKGRVLVVLGLLLEGGKQEEAQDRDDLIPLLCNTHDSHSSQPSTSLQPLLPSPLDFFI